MAKSIGWKTPSTRSDSHELKSHPKKRVDGQHHVGEQRPLVGVDEVEVDLVAIVQRSARVVADHIHLGTDRQRPHEQIERFGRLLEVHEAHPRLVVGAFQLLVGVDPRHPDPGSAVERLQEERIPELPADGGQIEHPGVALTA